jgi:thiol-disulfide isomerase/thioredoxin
MRTIVALLFAAALAAPAQLASLREAAKAATTGELQIGLLPQLGRAELDAGNLDAAEQAGRRLLEIADENRGQWNHDDIAHNAHTLLGRVALRRGDLDGAKEHLLASGRIAGSPVLGSFGPNLDLARELAGAGERETVLRYLALCRTFWKYDRGRIDQLVDQITRSDRPLHAANFNLKDLAGRVWTLNRLAGRPVLIDFWATWCGPCREDVPMLDKLAAEFRGQVVSLAVNVGEDEAVARRFAEEKHLTLPVLIAGDDAMLLDYHVGMMPALVLIGRDGSIADYRTGGVTEPELREMLRGVAGQRPEWDNSTEGAK